MKRLVASAILAATASCAYLPPPVTVVGPQSALTALAGEWWGDYVSEGPIERRGSIHFTLVEGEDHAHGDVLMIPAGLTRAYGRFRGEPGMGERHPTPEPLTIRIVRIEDGTIRGDLDPYWDPDRETSALTTFRGSVRGDSMTGTFTTTFESGPPGVRGRWKVTRTDGSRGH